MNILAQLREPFRTVLADYPGDADEWLSMIRPAQNAQFGDYEANFAMALSKPAGKPPRDLAGEIAGRVDLSPMCDAPEVAGPGFINLKLRDDWIVEQLTAALSDQRLLVPRAAEPLKVVIDYSSPNVAKPMHVGHIRSTVIGDSLYRTLSFLGHEVISDNHLGDWGTQFGMIIYGFKQFVDSPAYERAAVVELSRLYRLVHQLIDFHAARNGIQAAEQRMAEAGIEKANWSALERPADKKAAKEHKKRGEQLRKTYDAAAQAVAEMRSKIEFVENDPSLLELANGHPEIAAGVLRETVKLHQGDEENLRLWHEFMPACRQAIQATYDRLDVRFDYEYGESHYHGMLAEVVSELEQQGLARPSEGAMCLFLQGFEAPMIVRKKDGAFLYATTDLATIRYRMENWNPDAILYVVDIRQTEHFDKLFAASRQWGYTDVNLRHISFGTVMGKDGKPYKTRSGNVAGLESLLDEAVRHAASVVDENSKHLSASEREAISNTVGHGAVKYSDLAHNRTSDYIFDMELMVQNQGNTATYMQYSYARAQSIFAKAEVDVEGLRASFAEIKVTNSTERELAVALLQFGEVLDDVVAEFYPHLLTNYLFSLAKKFSAFFEKCPVIKAESKALMESRLLFCDLVARTIKLGLELLGIGVVPRM